jgi:type I restriction enzyme, S subunit
MSEWKEYKLGDIAEIVMGQSPKGDTCNESGVGVPLLNGPTEFTAFYPLPTQYTTDPKRFSETYDLLFCVRGSTTGKMNWSDQKYAIGRGIGAIRHRNGAKLNHFVKGIIIYHLPILLQSATGSTFPNVSREQLNGLKIKAPDLPTQTAIAEILSSLDDKIELNNKINQELENLAQTLFKQWFIDFEFPNENGEPYKSSGGEMVESELGEIPKGWEVSNLNQIARLVKNNIKPFENPDTLYFHYSLPEFDSGKIPSVDLGSTILSSKYEVSEHSILVSKLNPRIPRIWTIINPEPNSICSTEFQVLKPTKEVFFPFVNYLCKSEIYLSSLQSKVTGTSSSHQRVNPLDIINYEVVLPQIELFDKFFHSTYDFIQKIEKNIQENIQLTNLRDTLLPKLISGELEVSQTQTTA